MEREDLDQLVALRTELIKHFSSLRHYQQNQNALMKESEHAERIHRTIRMLDDVLKRHVNFS